MNETKEKPLVPVTACF